METVELLPLKVFFLTFNHKPTKMTCLCTKEILNISGSLSSNKR